MLTLVPYLLDSDCSALRRCGSLALDRRGISREILGRTSASVSRTDRPRRSTRAQIFRMATWLPAAINARAWPSVIRPASRLAWTCEGRWSSRSELATDGWLFPTPCPRPHSETSVGEPWHDGASSRLVPVGDVSRPPAPPRRPMSLSGCVQYPASCCHDGRKVSNGPASDVAKEARTLRAMIFAD